jgi:hypothetical protein
VPNAKRIHDSFSVTRMFLLSRVVRVKRGAEGALERFGLMKNKSKSVFLFEMH